MVNPRLIRRPDITRPGSAWDFYFFEIVDEPLCPTTDIQVALLDRNNKWVIRFYRGFAPNKHCKGALHRYVERSGGDREWKMVSSRSTVPVLLIHYNAPAPCKPQICIFHTLPICGSNDCRARETSVAGIVFNPLKSLCDTPKSDPATTPNSTLDSISIPESSTSSPAGSSFSTLEYDTTSNASDSSDGDCLLALEHFEKPSTNLIAKPFNHVAHTTTYNLVASPTSGALVSSTSKSCLAEFKSSRTQKRKAPYQRSNVLVTVAPFALPPKGKSIANSRPVRFDIPVPEVGHGFLFPMSRYVKCTIEMKAPGWLSDPRFTDVVLRLRTGTAYLCVRRPKAFKDEIVQQSYYVVMPNIQEAAFVKCISIVDGDQFTIFGSIKGVTEYDYAQLYKHFGTANRDKLWIPLSHDPRNEIFFLSQDVPDKLHKLGLAVLYHNIDKNK